MLEYDLDMAGVHAHTVTYGLDCAETPQEIPAVPSLSLMRIGN